MSNQKIIIVEGKTDKEFIGQYLQHLKKHNQSLDIQEENIKFEQLEGDIYSKRDRLTKILKQSKSKPCYIICDVDDQKQLYQETIIVILKDLKYENIDGFMANHVFLFPDNKNSGNLENLLDKILVDDKDFNECFNNYQTCLRYKGLRELPIKAKIYSYNYTNKVEEDENKYANADLYNLDSKELDALKGFCENIFSSSKEI